jgi:hypothetical protein
MDPGEKRGHRKWHDGKGPRRGKGRRRGGRRGDGPGKPRPAN